MVENSSAFRINFIFTQTSGTPGLAADLCLTGSNSFVFDGSSPLQVTPYGTTATPALTNFSLDASSFVFSGAADPAADQQTLLLATMVTAIGKTLEVTVGNVDSAAQIRCQFIGYPGSYTLSLGANSISFPLT